MHQTSRSLAIAQHAEKIEFAKTYIHHNLHQKLSISKIAAHVGINTCYLKIGFKTINHTTISNYIVSQRMEIATQHIHTNQKKLIEIAEIIGYASLSSFSQAYKKYHGISPQQSLKNQLESKTKPTEKK